MAAEGVGDSGRNAGGGGSVGGEPMRGDLWPAKRIHGGEPAPPADRLDWEPILTWLPVIAALGFDAGRVVGFERQPSGALSMPYTALSDDASRFVQALYEHDVVVGFDWPAWVKGPGGHLARDRDAVATAGLEDLRRLLTAYVRSDRFADGTLLHVLTDGTVVAILERVAALVRGAHERPPSG